MTKKENEFKTLQQTNEKNLAKLEKTMEKIKRYETKMNDIVDSRVGEVIAEKDAVVAAQDTIKAELAEVQDGNTRLKFLI